VGESSGHRVGQVGIVLEDRTQTFSVDERTVADCQDQLARHGVVVYPRLGIGDEDLVAFSRLFGDVVASPTKEHALPEIATITLDPTRASSVMARVRAGNFLWHIDGMTDELPQRTTLLSAVEVAEAGGDTEFASTPAALAAMPADRREEIAGLQVRHSFAAAQRRAHPDADRDEQARWERLAGRVHPLVWSHASGVESMLIGATAESVVGWEPAAGTALLDDLLGWATQPEFTFRHEWSKGDLVVWDNTTMLHRAMPFEPTSRRLMHRTTIVGTEPTR